MSALLERIQSFKLLGKTVYALAFAHLVFMLLVAIPTNFPPDLKEIDASIYYAAAQDVQRGVSLYTPKPNYGPHQKPFTYLYLPPFAAAIAPMAMLSETAFARVWFCIQLAFYFAFPLVLIRLRNALPTVKNYLLAYFALAICPGSFRAVGLGQVDAMIWVAFGLGILCLYKTESGRAIGAGTLLAAAALLKIYVGWSLLRFAIQRPKAFWSGMAFIGVGIIFGGIVCGWNSYAEWLRWIPAQVSQGTFDPDNWSVSMAILRLSRVLGWEYTAGPLTGLPLLWLKIAPLAAPVMALFLTRKHPLPLAAAICAVVGAISGPICWSGYLAILLVPAAIWLRNETEKAVGARASRPLGN